MRRVTVRFSLNVAHRKCEGNVIEVAKLYDKLCIDVETVNNINVIW